MSLKDEIKAPTLPQYKQYTDWELRSFHEKLQAKLPEIKKLDVGQMEFVAWKLGYMNRYEYKNTDGKTHHRFTICAPFNDNKPDYTSWRKFESFWSQYEKWREKQEYKNKQLVEVAVEREKTEAETLQEKKANLS